jgi:Putative restriction endonuclease
VTETPADWWLPEGNVPESATHDHAAKHLVLLLDAWAARQAQPVMIARNLAVRWVQSVPQVGIDPDVAVISPPPPNQARIDSLRLWEPGHVAPLLSFEVVSRNHPYKDYAGLHERYAAMGSYELVVFDPLLAGPRSLGGPVSLQVWRRDASGVLDRVYFGPGPFRSEVLDAWLVPAGPLLQIASDREGAQRWLTPEERERAEKERERAEKERERAEKERERAEKERERERRVEVERRLAALEVQLSERR